MRGNRQAAIATSLWLLAAPALAQAPAQGAAPRARFLEGAKIVIEALTVRHAPGDARDRLRSGLDHMRGALTRWDRQTATYERAATAASTAPDRAAAQRALALAYLDRDRLDDAVRELESATALDPLHADAWLLLGVTLGRTGHARDAARALTESSRLAPDNPVTVYLLAEQLREAGQAAAAEKQTEIFVRMEVRSLEGSIPTTPSSPPFPAWGLVLGDAGADPIFPPLRYADAFTKLRDGHYAEAIHAIEEAARTDPLIATSPAPADAAAGATTLGAAVERNPHDDRPRLALAAALENDNHVAEAEQVLRDAVAAMQESGQAHYALARVSDRRRHYDDARREYERSLTLGPVAGVERIHALLARLPHESDADGGGRLARATRWARRFPNSPGAHVELGAALLELDRAGHAAAEFLAALLIEPRNAEAGALLAQTFLRLGRDGDAEAAARRALAIEPDRARARYALATALSRLGRTEEARQEFSRYREMLKQAEADRARDFQLRRLLARARASVDTGRLDEGIDALRVAIGLKPDDVALRVSLGAFLMNAGRYGEARESLEQALAIDDRPEIHGFLADAYDALGRPRDAERHRRLSEAVRGCR